MIKELRRASFAAVELDDNGKKKNVITGTVSADMPQTAQSSEYCAALYAAITVKRAALLIGDCANVIRGWHRGKEFSSMAKTAYGGLLVSQGRHQPDMILDFLKV